MFMSLYSNAAMSLSYLSKRRGGRLQHVSTFLTACQGNQSRDALQAHDEAAEEEFSYVGLTSILEKPCVVKLMERGRMAAQEIIIQKWFTSHPHVNIVQGICNFTCKENPIKWVSRKKRP